MLFIVSVKFEFSATALYPSNSPIFGYFLMFDTLLLDFAILSPFSVINYYFYHFPIYLQNNYSFNSIFPLTKLRRIHTIWVISINVAVALIIWQIFHFNMNQFNCWPNGPISNLIDMQTKCNENFLTNIQIRLN